MWREGIERPRISNNCTVTIRTSLTSSGLTFLERCSVLYYSLHCQPRSSPVGQQLESLACFSVFGENTMTRRREQKRRIVFRELIGKLNALWVRTHPYQRRRITLSSLYRCNFRSIHPLRSFRCSSHARLEAIGLSGHSVSPWVPGAEIYHCFSIGLVRASVGAKNRKKRRV